MLNKNLLILMGGVLIAEMGMWLDLIGNLHFLQQHVSSHFLQSVILVVGTLVTILFSPAAGPLIDLMEKKKILMIASVMRMIGVLCMFPALQTGSRTIKNRGSSQVHRGSDTDVET